MPTITEEKLAFNFPAEWNASKFDEWSYYKGQFSRVGEAQILCKKKGCDGVVVCGVCQTKRVSGTRGVDILAIDPGSVCWNIEIKDYRTTRVKNFEFLADAVALKVRDTLSCLVVARFNANDGGERSSASQALACPMIRVVLHLEMSPTHSRLLSPKIQRANVKQRLRQLIQAIDPNALVVSMDDAGGMMWTVSSVNNP